MTQQKNRWVIHMLLDLRWVLNALIGDGRFTLVYPPTLLLKVDREPKKTESLKPKVYNSL